MKSARTQLLLTSALAPAIASIALFLVPEQAWAQSGAAGRASGGFRDQATMADNPLSDAHWRLALSPEGQGGGDLLGAASVQADAAGGETDDAAALAKKLSNPIASLISIPIQFNYDKGYGPKDAGRFVMNVQPVIPISLNEDWNLITRTIIPVINQESPADGVGSQFGLGDITQSFFFSPSRPVNGITWGVGPVLLWPTATDDSLSSEKWGAGPTAIVLKQEKGWTYGMLANHIWSYAGDEHREQVNATFLQPFISYTWPSATTLTFNTESSYDWNSDQWTVPLNLAVSQVVKIGSQRVSFGLGGRYYVETPDDGPEWGIRATVTLLFPK